MYVTGNSNSSCDIHSIFLQDASHANGDQGLVTENLVLYPMFFSDNLTL